MPEDQRLSLLLQRACRRDFARWRRGAKAPDSLVKGLEGTGGERARPTRAGGETVRQALHAARREAMGNSSKIRVGIVGLSPNRGFASIAHIPALRALPEFEIAAVCTTRQESAEMAGGHYGLPFALAAAERGGVRHAVGLQGQVSPAICYARDLIAQGYVGRVLTATMVGCAPN